MINDVDGDRVTADVHLDDHLTDIALAHIRLGNLVQAAFAVRSAAHWSLICRVARVIRGPVFLSLAVVFTSTV